MSLLVFDKEKISFPFEWVLFWIWGRKSFLNWRVAPRYIETQLLVQRIIRYTWLYCFFLILRNVCWNGPLVCNNWVPNFFFFLWCFYVCTDFPNYLVFVWIFEVGRHTWIVGKHFSRRSNNFFLSIFGIWRKRACVIYFKRCLLCIFLFRIYEVIDCHMYNISIDST